MGHTKGKLQLIKVHGIVIGVGVQVKDDSPIRIYEVYLNTLLPNEVKGKNRSAKRRRRDENNKYNDSVAAAKEVLRRWNCHDPLKKACKKYGQHKPDCNLLSLIRLVKRNGKPVGCTCGWDKAQAAIAAAEKAK